MYGITRALRTQPLRLATVCNGLCVVYHYSYTTNYQRGVRYNSGKVSGPVIGIDLGTTNSCVS